MKSTNDLQKTHSHDLTGSTLLITLLLTFNPLLEEDQLEPFQQMVTKKITDAMISVNPDEIKSFLSQEEQFQLTHLHLAALDEWINFIALQAGEVSAVCLGEPQVIAEWVDRFYQKKPCVWLKETD